MFESSPSYVNLLYTAKEWKDHVIRSDSFDKPSGHMNPSSFPVTSYTNEAEFVQVGAFALSKGIKSIIIIFIAHTKLLSFGVACRVHFMVHLSW